jgi:hypothetical protein
MLGVLARRFLHHLDTALGAVHYVTGDFRIHRHLSSASRAQTMPLRPSSWRSHPRGPDPSLLAAAFLSLAAPALPFTDCPGFTLPTVDHPSPPRAYTQGYQVESAAARAGHINPALQLLSLVLEQPGRIMDRGPDVVAGLSNPTTPHTTLPSGPLDTHCGNGFRNRPRPPETLT